MKNRRILGSSSTGQSGKEEIKEEALSQETWCMGHSFAWLAVATLETLLALVRNK